MNELDQMLNDSAVRFFTDLCTREILDSVEQGNWLPGAWADLREMGLVSAAVMEVEPDVHGLALTSLCTLARQIGRFNVPLPIVETYIAQRLLTQAGIPFDEAEPLSLSTFSLCAPVTLRETQGGYIANGIVRRVPWGRHVAGVVAAIQVGGKDGVALLPRGNIEARNANLAGEPRDTHAYQDTFIPASNVSFTDAGGILARLPLEGALFRSAQITGALQKVLEMTIAYAKDRQQFGRPIAKFQAIQHQIAELAAQVASATAAADAAVHANAGGLAATEIAFAKIRASEAATLACAIAHQVHGAMGFTHEHALHLSTRRLLSWRDEFGSDSHWAEWVGNRLEKLDGASLWRYITSPSTFELAQEH